MAAGAGGEVFKNRGPLGNARARPWRGRERAGESPRLLRGQELRRPKDGL